MAGAARPALLSLETDQHLVLLSNVSPEMVAGFVFDRTAPLGLARVQARQLSDQIRSTIAQLPESKLSTA